LGQSAAVCKRGKGAGLSALRSGGFVLSTRTGRARARVNVRPAPVPFRHPCWT
jgi:hypothetical protein